MEHEGGYVQSIPEAGSGRGFPRCVWVMGGFHYIPWISFWVGVGAMSLESQSSDHPVALGKYLCDDNCFLQFFLALIKVEIKGTTLPLITFCQAKSMLGQTLLQSGERALFAILVRASARALQNPDFVFPLSCDQL